MLGVTQNRSAVDRFTREAQAASALNHPNIITIHDIGESNGAHFIVMELVEGRTLRALAAQAQRLDMLVQVGTQVARALQRFSLRGSVVFSCQGSGFSYFQASPN